jgi:coproporphyrinogen III oxidase
VSSSAPQRSSARSNSSNIRRFRPATAAGRMATANVVAAAAAATPAAAESSTQQQQQQQQQGADFARFEAYVLDLQERIIAEAEALDGSGAKFVRDRWERAGHGGGYGITSVLEGGSLLEKAAANISIIHGKLSPQRAQAMSSRGRADVDPAGGQPYSAAAMSLVFHSAHPLVPTLRADVRLFQVAGCAWFGGGCDLTPSYLYEDDAAEFHRHWRGVCDRYGASVYPEFKAWCDKYFHIPCRGEHRGIGGIFFDDVATAEAGYDAEVCV